MQEKYLEYANNKFEGHALEIVKNQIQLFYQTTYQIPKAKYHVGDLVKLKQGTYIHGIFGYLENFDYTIQNGFISTDFTGIKRANKISHCTGMWKIKDNCLLKDYINLYSGFTITYSIGRGPDAKTTSKLIPYHQFDDFTEQINNDEKIWSYWGEKTKEVSFIPSLVSNKRQIAFILDMDNFEAQKLQKNDLWTLKEDANFFKPFLDERYFSKFLEERQNRTASTTDRETAIIFGLPINFVEGILVGRKLEDDEQSLKYIKEKLPNCYICNLDGLVIK